MQMHALIAPSTSCFLWPFLSDQNDSAIKSSDSEGWATPAQWAGTHCHILRLHSSCNPDSTSDPVGPSGIYDYTSELRLRM